MTVIRGFRNKIRRCASLMVCPARGPPIRLHVRSATDDAKEAIVWKPMRLGRGTPGYLLAIVHVEYQLTVCGDLQPLGMPSVMVGGDVLPTLINIYDNRSVSTADQGKAI